MNVHTVMVTALRSEIYIHNTLKSLDESGYYEQGGPTPVRVVVGSFESSYLDAYRDKKDRYAMEDLKREDAERAGYEGLQGTQKCSFTHTLALSDAKIPPDKDTLLILEDDLKFSRGWWKRLKAIAEDIMGLFPKGWVLSLYAPFTTATKKAFQEGKLWIRRSLKLYSFFGTQAVLYPRTIGVGFGAYLYDYSVKTFKRPIDHLLSEYLNSIEIPMFSTAPCLVQHVGTRSEGVSAMFHYSHGFVEDVRQ